MTTTAEPRAGSPTAASRALFEEGCRFIPGGSSRVHYFYEPYPIFARSGSGCRLVDADGVERLDFLNNMTALIHGHAHPAITRAIQEQLALGTAFSEPAASEIELARLLVGRVRSLERIRFSNSGSEAVMLAVKLARQFTGRSRIAKFEGHYHGYYDYVQVSVRNPASSWGPAERPVTLANSGGLANSVVDDVLTLPFNDLAKLEPLLAEHGRSIACLLCDPLAAQAGCPIPKRGYLDQVTELCRRYGIVLLYDEVVSFRLDHGGAQQRYGGTPDLITLGKIIGGGLPIGAVGGRADIMGLLDPTRGAPPVISGGTYSANPLTMVAGRACMELLTPAEFTRINALGDRLRRESNRVFEAAGLKVRMGGDGSLIRINPVVAEVVDYRSIVIGAEPPATLLAIHKSLLEEGIIISRLGMGALSTPMGDAEVTEFVRALERAVAR